MTKTTKEYHEQDAKFGARIYASNLDPVIARGWDCYLEDIEGNVYFDMLSGYSAVNQGHVHPKIIKALVNQANKLTMTSRAFRNNVMSDCLEKIANLTGMDKVLPMNTGAEGVETAIKAMRRWGLEVKGVKEHWQKIIVAENNFHGRTSTIVSFSSDDESRRGFGPHIPGFHMVPYDKADVLEMVLEGDKNIVGVLLEPIQGEAGINIPSQDYFGKVRAACDKNNVLLCADEIQTGLGRTGKLFCCDHWGIKPDIYILGKALGGGAYPVSAIACNNEVMNVFTPGSHGSTYGGNPLGMAVAMASLDVLLDPNAYDGMNLIENSAKRGEQFMNLLSTLKSPLIKEIRGKGLMIGLEFNNPIAHEVCEKLVYEGILAKDSHDNVVRFAPPLVIGEKQVEYAFESIRRAITKL